MFAICPLTELCYALIAADFALLLRAAIKTVMVNVGAFIFLFNPSTRPVFIALHTVGVMPFSM